MYINHFSDELGIRIIYVLSLSHRDGCLDSTQSGILPRHCSASMGERRPFPHPLPDAIENKPAVRQFSPHTQNSHTHGKGAMTVMRPASSAVAPTVPKRWYIAVENRGKAAANVVRMIAFPVRAWCGGRVPRFCGGRDSGRHIICHWSRGRAYACRSARSSSWQSCHLHHFLPLHVRVHVASRIFAQPGYV